MKKTSYKNKPYHLYVLVFFLSFLLLSIIYFFRGVYPFGINSVLALDLNGQYIYYYEYYRAAFFTPGGLFYSFSRTLGGEMVGILAYYLASPFSIVFLLFSQAYITEAILLMILLKVATAAVTMALYWRKVHQSDDRTSLIFALLYAFMSYMMVHTINPMFLDGLIWLPMIALGIDQLIKKRRIFTLSISLALMFISHFYIGYMLGILSFIWFIAQVYIHCEKQSFQAVRALFIQFFLAAALAIGLSLWILLPTFYSLQLGKLGFTSPNFTPMQLVSIFDIAIKALPLVYDSVNYHGFPFIYSGLLVIPLVILFIIHPTIGKRIKIAYLSVLVFGLILFTVSTFDIVMHGFQSPNWLNFRYSFFISFVMLVMAYYSYQNIHVFSRKTLFRVFSGYAIFVFWITDKNYDFIIVEYTLWFSVIALILYYICLIYNTKLLRVLFVILILQEVALNGAFIIEGMHKEVYYSNRPSYREYFDPLIPLVNQINESDHSFFRSETTSHRTVNDPMTLGIYGLSHSSSTLNQSVIRFLDSLGLSSKEHWTRYKGYTELTNSLFNMRYLYSKQVPSIWYNEIASKGEWKVYINPYELPLAFPVNRDIIRLVLDSDDPFINQNILLSMISGSNYQEFFKPIPIQDVHFDNISDYESDDYVYYKPTIVGQNAHIEYILENQFDNPMYMFFTTVYPKKINLWNDTRFVDVYFDYQTTCIVPIVNYNNQATISLITTLIEQEYFLSANMFYYLDMPLFIENIQQIQQRPIDIIQHASNKLTLTTQADNNQILLTTIPYDLGWRIKVNGSSTKPIMVFDALMAIEIPAGTSVVTLHYLPRGFIMGSMISAISLVYLLWLWRKKR